MCLHVGDTQSTLSERVLVRVFRLKGGLSPLYTCWVTFRELELLCTLYLGNGR